MQITQRVFKNNKAGFLIVLDDSNFEEDKSDPTNPIFSEVDLGFDNINYEGEGGQVSSYLF